MKRKSTLFALSLLGILILIFLMHLGYFYVSSLEIPWTYLALGYGVNYAMALAIYITLLYLAKIKQSSVGFFFLLGSALKFGVYFWFFRPLFMQDGFLSRVEYFTFFAPYFFCLITETSALVKLLKAMDEK